MQGFGAPGPIELLILGIVVVVPIALAFWVITGLIRNNRRPQAGADFKPCPACGEQVSIRTDKCPYCGSSVQTDGR